MNNWKTNIINNYCTTVFIDYIFDKLAQNNKRKIMISMKNL